VGSEGSLTSSPDWRALLADARARGCVVDVEAEAVERWSVLQVCSPASNPNPNS
tara:strand:- start:85 stop:246 length:162 start_codon:yes stop_codon:yes gene_type:complete